MCLGDIRFMPLVRTVNRTLTVPTVWDVLLEANPNRAAVILASPDVNQYTFWFGRAPSVNLTGVRQFSTFQGKFTFTYQEFGDMVQQDVFADGNGVTTIDVIELIAPEWVFSKLRQAALALRDEDYE